MKAKIVMIATLLDQLAKMGMKTTSAALASMI
jgi:hypothetical protein